MSSEWFPAGHCMEQWGSSDPREAEYFRHESFARRRDDGVWELAYRQEGRSEFTTIAELLPGDDLADLLRALMHDGYERVWGINARAYDAASGSFWLISAVKGEDRSRAVATIHRNEKRDDSPYSRRVGETRFGVWRGDVFTPVSDGACLRSWGDDFYLKDWHAAVLARLRD